MVRRKSVKKSKTDGLSRAELTLIAQLLRESSNEFSNHGCNDYNIPATDENKQIILDMFEENGDIDDREEEVEEVKSAKDEITTYDWWLMSYLSRRCKNLSEKK